VTRSRHTRRPAAAAALALAAGATVAAAFSAADSLPVTLTSRGGQVAAAVDLTPVLPKNLEERLGNGLRNVVAIFVAVVPVDGGAPAAAYGRVLEVLYDVWEETWAVTIRDPQSPSGRRQILRTAAELHRLLARAADADLGPAAGLPAGPFTVDVRVDVNPVSPELLARTREYLAGAARPAGSSRSVLGTVAGYLLREPDDQGGSFVYRSRTLTSAGVQP
jgi:hypothetical protein